MKDLVAYLTSHVAVRYVISGGTAAVVNLATFSALHYGFRVPPVVASVCASLVAFAASFYMQKYFTFRETHHPSLSQVIRYAVVFFVNIGMTTGFFLLFLGLLRFALLDQFLAIALTALISFFLYRLFVFRAETSDARMAP